MKNLVTKNLPEKYKYRPVRDEKRIFNFDSQGFPLHKQNIRDILIGLGLDYNKETNKWEISDDNPILETCINILEDDGMGYGVNLQHISEASIFEHNKEYICNIFVEKPLPEDKIPLWLKSKFYLGSFVVRNDDPDSDKKYCIRDIVQHDEHPDKLFYICQQYTSNIEPTGDTKVIEESCLDYD